MERKTGSFGNVAHQRGLAMVEFAIGLPILLLLLLGVGEVGRMFSQYNTLTIATRDAARYVSRNAVDPVLGPPQSATDLPASLQATTRNLLVYNSPVAGTPILAGLTPADVQIGIVAGDHIQVTVTYTYRPMVVTAIPGFFGDVMPLELPLTATTVMRAM